MRTAARRRALPSGFVARAGMIALLTAGGAGCAGSGVGLDENGEPAADMATPDDGPRIDGGASVSLRDLQAKIFSPVCASRCHTGAGAPKGLQLDPANTWNLLVKVPSVEVPSLLRVDPGHPESSYLIAKLTVTDPRRKGARMPLNGPPYLSDSQIKLIRRWIQEGAQK